LNEHCLLIYRDPLDHYLSAARFFRLNYDLYADFNIVLRDGILAEFEELNPPGSGPNEDQDEVYVTWFSITHK
jgi:hypothetical protein